MGRKIEVWHGRMRPDMVWKIEAWCGSDMVEWGLKWCRRMRRYVAEWGLTCSKPTWNVLGHIVTFTLGGLVVYQKIPWECKASLACKKWGIMFWNEAWFASNLMKAFWGKLSPFSPEDTRGIEGHLEDARTGLAHEGWKREAWCSRMRPDLLWTCWKHYDKSVTF